MDESVEDVFAMYDPLAEELVGCDMQNTEWGLVYSNREMVEYACAVLDVEDIDLFTKFDFDKVFAEGSGEECLANAFVAFLRYRVFSEAQHRGVGIASFNEAASAHSEKWYITLVHRWHSLGSGDDKVWTH